MWNATHSYVWRDSFRCVTSLIHMCDMTHWWAKCHRSSIDGAKIEFFLVFYVERDSFTCVKWLNLTILNSMWRGKVLVEAKLEISLTWYVWHDSFICVPWLIHMCAMTHSYVWHDSFTCATYLINFDQAKLKIFASGIEFYVRRDSYHYMCDKFYIYVWTLRILRET